VYRYVFTNFDSVTGAIIKSTRIGFAVPLRGDEFQVVRFDLTGATAAIGRCGPRRLTGSNRGAGGRWTKSSRFN
jgi:hypothetical protein